MRLFGPPLRQDRLLLQEVLHPVEGIYGVTPSAVGATPSFPPAGGTATAQARDRELSNSTVSKKKGGKSLAKKQGGGHGGFQKGPLPGPSGAVAGAAGIPSSVSSSTFCCVFLSHVVSYDVWLPRCDNMSQLPALRRSAHKGRGALFGFSSLFAACLCSSRSSRRSPLSKTRSFFVILKPQQSAHIWPRIGTVPCAEAQVGPTPRHIREAPALPSAISEGRGIEVLRCCPRHFPQPLELAQQLRCYVGPLRCRVAHVRRDGYVCTSLSLLRPPKHGLDQKVVQTKESCFDAPGISPYFITPPSSKVFL